MDVVLEHLLPVSLLAAGFAAFYIAGVLLRRRGMHRLAAAALVLEVAAGCAQLIFLLAVGAGAEVVLVFALAMLLVGLL